MPEYEQKSEERELRLSSAETHHFEPNKINIDDLSGLDTKPYVETIAEENEPDSNISTILHDSQPSTPVGGSIAKKDGIIGGNDTAQQDHDQDRDQLNSTMKGFNNTEDMMVTAKFGHLRKLKLNKQKLKAITDNSFTKLSYSFVCREMNVDKKEPIVLVPKFDDNREPYRL